MRIGIIGAGSVGSALARRLVGIGHEVAISNSRDPETLSGLVAELGDGGRAVTAAQAAEFGQVVIVSIPYGHYQQLPADALRDKVVVDTCNYYPQRDGRDPDLDSGATTSSEKVRSFIGAEVTKAFNSVYARNLRDRGRPAGDPERLAIPVSGDDGEAKAVVSGLIRDIGFDPVDAGRLGAGGRRQQPGSRVYTAELNADELAAALHAE